MENVSLSPNVLFFILGFPVTNTFLLQIVLSAALIIIILLLVRRLKKVPSKPQVVFEMLVEFVLKNVDSATGDRAKTKKIFPYIATLFFFIFFCNIFTLVPGISALTVRDASGVFVSPFRAVLSDYGTVFILTIVSIFIAQVVFIAYQGLGTYLKQWFDFSSPLAFVLGLMNIIGELAKVLSLSFRLFGNLFAGEVLTSTILYLCAFLAPIPFMFLSMLTCFIQAFVFSLLSAIYIGQSMKTPEPEVKVVEKTADRPVLKLATVENKN